MLYWMAFRAASKVIRYSVNITLGMFQEYDVLQFRVLTWFYLLL